MSSGFLFNELSEFKQDLMRDIQSLFPKETDEFLKEEAKKFKKEVLKVARKNVKANETHYRKNRKTGEFILDKNGKKIITNYHKRFKIGKKYVRGESRCLRVYNSARHAHLLEYGHVSANKYGKNGFVLGKMVFKEAELNFKSEFLDDAEKFLYTYFDKTTGK